LHFFRFALIFVLALRFAFLEIVSCARPWSGLPSLELLIKCFLRANDSSNSEISEFDFVDDKNENEEDDGKEVEEE